ncbi:SgcJ/EcaC family oxidoreductase [Deinococcus aluminii]
MTNPERVLEAYKAAVYAKDVDAFMSLYDEDVQVFDMWGTWSYDGAAAWRGMVTDWFASLGTERVVVDMEEVQTILTDEVAVAHAFVTYRGVSAEGQALRAMQNRLTCVLKQRGGTWKIVHEHSSAPADFETSKVILQR